MRCLTFLFTITLLAASCIGEDANDSTGQASPERALPDPNIGTYYLTLAEDENGVLFYPGIRIREGNVFNYTNLYFPNGDTTIAYYEKGIGTYTKTGSKYTVTYSYQTCYNDSEVETYTISGSNPDEAIGFTVDSATLVFRNVKAHAEPVDSNNLVALIEDKDCIYGGQ